MTPPSPSHVASTSEDKVQSLTIRRRIQDSDLRPTLLRPAQWPIVYHPRYNVACFGLEKLHPFDAGKWGHVFDGLVAAGWLTPDTILTPREAHFEDLRIAHTRCYLRSLSFPCSVAKAVEVPSVMFLPGFVLDKVLLRALRYQVGGTVAAAYAALQRGWAINIGGGFHHASGDRGGGFCVYNDVTVAIQFVINDLSLSPGIERVMIVDLDAHQGNGYERDFVEDARVYILDAFNYSIYPRDQEAKVGINRAIRLKRWTQDGDYLRALKSELPAALAEFHPQLIVYNAGTDCFEDDPLGCLSLTRRGIVTRDEYVFRQARDNGVPIVMVTSGGYTRESASIIVDSIQNLHDKELITLEPLDFVKKSKQAVIN